MKHRFLLAVLAIALSPPAFAGDVSVKLDDSAQNVVLQLPGTMDGCVASMLLRNDVNTCKQLSSILVALGNEVRNAQSKATADAKTAAEDAKKKAQPDAGQPQDK